MNESERANEASLILESRVYTEAMDGIRQAALSGLRTADLSNAEALRSRVALFQVCEQFEASLKNMVAVGEMAQEFAVKTEEKPRRAWYMRGMPG